MAGGYLVLERPNPGLVLSTTARFYAIVRPIHDELSPDSWAWVRPSSPQSSGFRATRSPLILYPCAVSGVGGCEGDLPSALPGGRLQAIHQEFDAPIDVRKASRRSFAWTKVLLRSTLDLS